MISELVAVGTNPGSAAFTAPPAGSPWTAAATTATLYAVASSEALVVAVGLSACQTFDGVTWTPQTIPAGSYFAIVWTGKQWVAVGANVAATSPDGINWTARAIPAGSWNSIAWNGVVLVAVGSSGCVTSPDGITWTIRTIPAGTYNGLAWSGAVFTAVGVSIAASSPDGTTWTARTIPAGTYNYVAWSGTVFAAVGAASVCATSPDGINWTARTIPAGTYQSTAWDGIVFAAAGVNVAAVSSDGISWISVAFPGGNAYGMTFTGGFTARAMSTHRVRAFLNSGPQAVSPALAGDALNPATWTVTRISDGRAWTVLTASLIVGNAVDIFVAEPLDPAPQQFQLACPTLLSSTGVIITTSTANFSGLGIVASARVGPSQAIPFDLANRQVPASDTAGGTLVIDASGDYKSETGAALLRKLVVRRLTTAPGGLFHLPGYGAGIAEKSPFRESLLPKIRRLAEEQVALEPELQNVHATLAWDPGHGILRIKVSAIIRQSGTPFSADARVALQL